MPTKKEQLKECLRAMDEGMLVTGTAAHVYQIDIPRLLWWMCKSLYLILEWIIRQK